MHILTGHAGHAASACSTAGATCRIPRARSAVQSPEQLGTSAQAIITARTSWAPHIRPAGPRTRRAVWPASRRTLSRSVRHRLVRTSCGFVSIMQFGHRRAAQTPPHGSAIRTCKRRVAEPFIRSTAHPRIFVLRITRAARPRARPAALCSADCCHSSRRCT